MRTELKEKSRGVFYRKSKATLHFHEDPAGLFADMRIADVFVRFPVNTGGGTGGAVGAAFGRAGGVPTEWAEAKSLGYDTAGRLAGRR